MEEKIDKIFNKMRARLFSMIEQMDGNLTSNQQDACKQRIKDITGNAWNDVKTECNPTIEE